MFIVYNFITVIFPAVAYIFLRQYFTQSLSNLISCKGERNKFFNLLLGRNKYIKRELN